MGDLQKNYEKKQKKVRECARITTEWIEESINLKQKILNNKNLLVKIVRVAYLLANTIERGNKILVCGNGGSASDAAHFSAELLNQLCLGRTSALPAIDLTAFNSTITAIGNDWGYEDVFSKPLQALGQKDDVLIAISTSGTSKNILNAIEAAREKGIYVVMLTGSGKGKENLLDMVSNFVIAVPDERTSIIQESHIMILHILVNLMDYIRFDVDYLDKRTW
jgi:D-sedoheptulose 7-phosphate isomerase